MVLRSTLPDGDGQILVVEDETVLRLDLVALLEDAGLDVLEAADADEALNLLAGHPDVRILLTDVQMPGSMDGLHLVHHVRKNWPGVGLMLMSGNLNMPTHLMPARCFYLEKPFDRRRLISAIASFG
jgi:CheY-like chemotaxis protein